MITGIDPTGSLLNNMVLRQFPTGNKRILAQFPANQLGPMQGNGSNLEVYGYRGGPTIRTLPNGDVNVRRVHWNGFNVIIRPGGNTNL